MDASKDRDDQYSDKEAARRRDEALKRALNMPPKPRKNHMPVERGSITTVRKPHKRAKRRK